MKELTKSEKELLEMLDELFDYSEEEAYYQLLLIIREIQVQFLQLEIELLRKEKLQNIDEMGKN